MRSAVAVARGAGTSLPGHAAFSSPGVIVPAGALDVWRAYRATNGAARGEVVGIGDSTMFGSEGLYSFLSRLRKRSTTAGIVDGGKGMFAGGEGFGGIIYDTPEVNGFVSSTFNGSADGYDNTDGQYWYDDGTAANRTLVLQFRQSGARLWYSARTLAGDFTYSVDGSPPVTVKAYGTGEPISRYVHITGLAADTLHTVTITNLAVSTSGGPATGSTCYIALAPMNATGLTWQKYATSGDTINNRFYGQIAATPYTQTRTGMRYQTAFGLATTLISPPGYAGAPVDATQPAAGKINPVLAMSNLGFNDLSNVTTTDLPMWVEYVRRFAGACKDAGCSGVVLAGQLPYNAQWTTYGAARFAALRDTAAEQGLAFVDLLYPIAGPSLSYTGGVRNPHLLKAEYEAQGDFIWDSLLAV